MENFREFSFDFPRTFARSLDETMNNLCQFEISMRQIFSSPKTYQNVRGKISVRLAVCFTLKRNHRNL